MNAIRYDAIEFEAIFQYQIISVIEEILYRGMIGI